MNFETCIETMGLENNVFAIEIPTEMVTDFKRAGAASKAKRRCSQVTCSSAWNSMTAAGLLCAMLRAFTGFVGSHSNPAPLTRDE